MDVSFRINPLQEPLDEEDSVGPITPSPSHRERKSPSRSIRKASFLESGEIVLQDYIDPEDDLEEGSKVVKGSIDADGAIHIQGVDESEEESYFRRE